MIGRFWYLARDWMSEFFNLLTSLPLGTGSNGIKAFLNNFIPCWLFKLICKDSIIGRDGIKDHGVFKLPHLLTQCHIP